MQWLGTVGKKKDGEEGLIPIAVGGATRIAGEEPCMDLAFHEGHAAEKDGAYCVFCGATLDK